MSRPTQECQNLCLAGGGGGGCMLPKELRVLLRLSAPSPAWTQCLLPAETRDPPARASIGAHRRGKATKPL